MEIHQLRSFSSELQSSMVKSALIERLVRLGATDVEDLPGVRNVLKSTPRLFMRKRSPAELGQLQQSVQGFFDRYEKPAIAKAKSAIEGKISNPRARSFLNRGAEMVIKNPEIGPLQFAPIPGATPAWLGAKKGLELAIDKLAPVPSR